MIEQSPVIYDQDQLPEQRDRDQVVNEFGYPDEDTKALEAMGDTYSPPKNNTLGLGEVLEIASREDDGGVIDFRKKNDNN